MLIPIAIAVGSNISASKTSRAATTNLYSNPQLIEIVGYDQDAMEPCVSLDGRYLFFNNSNELKDTHIFWARRLTPTKFQFGGMVPGTHLVNNPPTGDEREACPSVDSSNHFYFTSTHSYRKDLRTLDFGDWTPEGLNNVRTVQGNIAPPAMSWIDMDCGISPDGNTLIFSRAKITNGSVPQQSFLMLAHRTADGTFDLDPNSEQTLKEINTPALQYAPAITADGLELYWTRCENATVPLAGMLAPPLMQTMVAFRQNNKQPFAKPARIAAIEGFAEAPSLTLDKRELFFHKKVGNRFRVFRLVRSSV